MTHPAAEIPNPAVPWASPVFSVAPVTLDAPGRGAALQLRVSAPVDGGERLPIVIFSHGYAQSLHAYGPLADHWAAHGFVVVQPTHLDSWMEGLAPDDPRTPQIWRHREQDLVRVLDGLDRIEAQVPAIRGRLDHDRIAVAGHSWGATTASMLLGAAHPDPDDGAVVDIADARVKAGVLLALAGTGGENLTPFAAANFAFMNPDFSRMLTPALMVAGDKDVSLLSVRGADWWRDGYDLSPGAKALLTVFGGEHSLGGVHTYETDHTPDASRARVAAIQHLSTAYLRSALYPGDPAWDRAVAALAASEAPQGRVETK